jgi:glycosyltransferase involved in cell wall biosynthesis
LVKGDHYGARIFPKDIGIIYGGGLLVDLSDRPAEVQQSVIEKVRKHKPFVVANFDPLTDREIAEVYLAMDGFVFPSRGEGFGLPPLEAMSCGIPVVGTAATGMKEFMREDICYPVASRGWKLEPRCDWITGDYVGQLFADPDYIQYRDAVWQMYSNREEAKAKAKKAREFVVANYRAELMVSRMNQRLEEIMGGKKTTENFWPEEGV